MAGDCTANAFVEQHVHLVSNDTYADERVVLGEMIADGDRAESRGLLDDDACDDEAAQAPIEQDGPPVRELTAPRWALQLPAVALLLMLPLSVVGAGGVLALQRWQGADAVWGPEAPAAGTEAPAAGNRLRVAGGGTAQAPAAPEAHDDRSERLDLATAPAAPEAHDDRSERLDLATVSAAPEQAAAVASVKPAAARPTAAGTAAASAAAPAAAPAAAAEPAAAPGDFERRQRAEAEAAASGGDHGDQALSRADLRGGGDHEDQANARAVSLQVIEQETFQVFAHFDYPDKGDVMSKKVRSAEDVRAVKRLVVQKGYGGFSLRDGTAWIKGGPPEGPGTPEDLKFMGSDDKVFFFLLAGHEGGVDRATESASELQALASMGLSDYNKPLCQDTGLRAEFSSYRWYDLPNRGDVGIPLRSGDINEAMRIVKKEGYSGFNVFGGEIYFKKVEGGLSVSDLAFNQQEYDSTFYLHNRQAGSLPQVVPSRTMYMYRAQSDSDYPFENVNAGDLTGVMWYLHNEVMTMCPRKYSIVRIKRLKVTLAPSALVPRYFGSTHHFGDFMAFDNGQCTTPGCVDTLLQAGSNPGCQKRPYANIQGYWYSMPGPCPGEVGAKFQKSSECVRDQPGGACGCEANLGDGSCSYHWEDAGDIELSNLTGINATWGGKDPYKSFCETGNLEYEQATDQGRGFHFWDGFEDSDRALERIKIVLSAFHEKYPALPLHLGPEGCP